MQVEDEVIQLLERTNEALTSTQIALKISRSPSRVHNVLVWLYQNGIVDRDVIEGDREYGSHKRYYVWSMSG